LDSGDCPRPPYSSSGVQAFGRFATSPLLRHPQKPANKAATKKIVFFRILPALYVGWNSLFQTARLEHYTEVNNAGWSSKMINTNCVRCWQLAVSFAVISLATFLCQINASGQSASFTRTDYPTLGNNHIVADLNGDGIPDLAGTGVNSAAVMLGNGDGTFRAKVNYPAGGQTQDLAAGDFNGDGSVDLVVSLNDLAFSLSLLTGNGDGTFKAPVNFDNTGAQEDSPAVVATDLDNDGRLDVVLAHAIACFVSPCVAARTITVMLGFGDGTFQLPFDIDVGTGMSRIAVGDFNRDGIKDLGIAGDNSRVYTLLGVGNGTFLKQPVITLTADTLFVDGSDIDIADLNGDAIQDLVVAIPTNGSRTAILIGNGDGTFQAARILTESGLRVPQYQVIADFNRDGFQDLALALANGTNGLFEILNGNGDGTFDAPLLYMAPPPLSSVGGGTLVTGDFNRDGRPDIALPIVGANPALAGLVNSTGSISVAPAYGSVTATPSTVVGGASTEIQVSLVAGAVAPSSGFSFSVSSSNSTVLQVPASIFMPAGTSSVRFVATTRTVTLTQTVNIRIRNNQLGRTNLTVAVTPAAPTPAPLSLSSLTLASSAVVGGNAVQGRVTLSAAAPAATVVNLASSSTAASVPASVTVAAGASSAAFNINTTTVTATTSAIISGTFNGLTRSATLTINPVATPPPPSTDTVRITRAEFDSAKRTLRVEATSTTSNATLQVFVTATGQLLGTLANSGGGQYRAELGVATNPQNITVRSSLGGVATSSVVAK
jgi:hypothetical protein